MENINSTSGIAEDIIRSLTHIACDEMHKKTLLEKADSQLKYGMINVDKSDELQSHLKKIEELRDEVNAIASIRRRYMIQLRSIFNDQGDKEQWCSFKHQMIAMMCAFEAWQASNDDEDLYQIYLELNQMFTKTTAKFLGVEITECASCLSDMLKGG